MDKRLPPKVRRIRPILRHGLLALIVLYAVLLLPDPEPPAPAPAKKHAFAWNQDARWSLLEKAFDRARGMQPDTLARLVDTDIARLGGLNDLIARERRSHADTLWSGVESAVFESATRVAACRSGMGEYASLLTRLRALVKEQSTAWDLRDAGVRDRLYRLLYGSRAALEEVMLQAPPESIPAFLRGIDEPSRAPAA